MLITAACCGGTALLAQEIWAVPRVPMRMIIKAGSVLAWCAAVLGLAPAVLLADAGPC